MENFIKELLVLQHNDISEALDKVFDFIDDACLIKDYDKVILLLDTIPIDELNTDVIVGILTITSVWKTFLPNRSNFYNKVFIKVSKECSSEEALFILDKLN